MAVVNEDGMIGADGWGSGAAVAGGSNVIVTVTVRSLCLSGVRVLGFLRGVIPKKEIDHVRCHVVYRVDRRSHDRSRD